MSEQETADKVQGTPRPVTILSGSLGAGKTTTLNHLLATSELDIAVVVNDMGSLNVDAELVDVQRDLEGGDSRIAELSNGCICCGLQGELRNELFQLGHSYDFEYLVIEASGISEPAPIAQQLAGNSPVGELYSLDTTVTVVDAPRFAATFGGETPEREGADESGRRPLSDLAIEQVEFCDVLLLNKRDLVDDATAERVERLVTTLQPTAEQYWMTQGRIDPERVLGTGRFDAKTVANSAGWKRALAHADAHDDETSADHDHDHTGDDHGHGLHGHGHEDDDSPGHNHDDHSHNDHDGHSHEEHNDHDSHGGHDHDHDHLHPPEMYGVDSVTYKRRRPFHPERLKAWLSELPDGVIRAKGLVWIAGRGMQAYTLSLVGQSSQIKVNGQWIASLPEDHQDKFRRAQPDLDWHEEHGDREQRLAVLGTGLAADEITASLDDCLVTDEEWDSSLSAVENPFPEIEGSVLRLGSNTAAPYE